MTLSKINVERSRSTLLKHQGLPSSPPLQSDLAGRCCRVLGFKLTVGDCESKMPNSPELKRKMLADVRREDQNLTVMGMRPDLKPEERETVRNLERSARAR